MSILKQIQESMKKNNVHYYIIPTNDYHQSEYVADFFKLREFVSGFNGSAGTLVIEQERAGLWTDSRYFLQAETQLPKEITLHKLGSDESSDFPAYIAENIKAGQAIGFDAKCISTSLGKHLLGIAEKKNSKILLDVYFADELWKERQTLPKNTAYFLNDDITGENISSKIKYITDVMKEHKCNYTALTKLDDIAYLLNMRGTDVTYNPVFYSYVSIEFREDFNNYTVKLYIDDEKLQEDTKKYLSENNIQILPYENIYDDIKFIKNRNILLDESALNFMLYTNIDDTNSIVDILSPITSKKAVKNDTELKNSIYYHKIDAVAVIKLIHYVKTNIKKIDMSEISVSDKLEEFRRQCDKCVDLSFDTISGYKDHGAIVHYSATGETNYKLEPKSILLLDSGAQYLGATTDITRSISLGTPTDTEKFDFTTVLKGHLALSNAVFPENTTGSQLDTIAKEPIWRENLNFFHGTGHGVGAFLNVHEGPMRISGAYNNVGFKRGMVVSNEPGLYRAGHHGIRIENLVYTEFDKETEFGKFLKFIDLTLVPIDLDLVDVDLLNSQEKLWLNNYHKRVFDEISPLIEDKELKEFLKQQTRQI
ncbi:MAG: aminopeptidase P family N-terminal domain-containing protein [Peptoanaerobacter stomatis]|uniref:aminopeptidase P family N-terminal domain-containing protein n=1 Tax=Peptoanaerobacter stomatis TaxID=796937 RepID=UPI003F9ED967